MIIDYSNILAAEDYYESQGYLKASVPWIVGNEAYNITRPSFAGRDFTTLGGNLIASAEQAFIELMLQEINIDKAQATTPCFRDEEHNELNHTYFMKTELINTNATNENLVLMIDQARIFFSAYLPVKIIETGHLTFDIITQQGSIELGSYGIREYKDLKWIYGTGVAEPRLTQVQEKLSWW